MHERILAYIRAGMTVIQETKHHVIPPLPMWSSRQTEIFIAITNNWLKWSLCTFFRMNSEFQNHSETIDIPLKNVKEACFISPLLRSPGFTVRNLSSLFKPVLDSCWISPFRYSGYRLVFSKWKRRDISSQACRSSDDETDERAATPWHVHVARRPSENY